MFNARFSFCLVWTTLSCVASSDLFADPESPSENLASQSKAVKSQLLFESGKSGYKRYRIPALIVAPDQSVLAICEGRKGGGGLTGNIDIVMKRSRDNGKASFQFWTTVRIRWETHVCW
jgi:hypothetical protein